MNKSLWLLLGKKNDMKWEEIVQDINFIMVMKGKKTYFCALMEQQKKDLIVSVL